MNILNSDQPFTLARDKNSGGEQLLLYKGGTVCGDAFDKKAAEAICRNMHYESATGWTSSSDIQNDYIMKLNHVMCSGEEWKNCTYSEDNKVCEQGKYVFLNCTGN